MRPYLPAADEVFRLQSGDGPECVFFRTMATDGRHVAPDPHHTRQGIYCFAPSGRRLGSILSNDPKRVAAMIEDATKAWNAMPEADRFTSEAIDERPAGRIRYEWSYPEDGLVLRITSRDLPTDPAADDPDATRASDRWNHDHIWFTKDEAIRLCGVRDTGVDWRAGHRAEVPRALVERLARFHFVDNVCGQTIAYDADHVREARIESTIESIEGDVVRLRYSGHAACEGTRGWRSYGTDPSAPAPSEQRALAVDIRGEATFDRAEGVFTRFEWVAIGTRSGATRYNGRQGRRDPSPIGFYLSIAPDRPADRVPPAFFQLYGWDASAERNWASLEPAAPEGTTTDDAAQR